MARQLSLVLVLILVVLTGCHRARPTTPVPLSCGSGESLIRDQLFFGRGLPDGGEVSDSAWRDFLAAKVTPRFPDGITVFDARGQWRGSSGEVVRERSWVLVLYHAPSEGFDQAVAGLIASYRSLFQQEAVLHDRTPACVTF